MLLPQTSRLSCLISDGRLQVHPAPKLEPRWGVRGRKSKQEDCRIRDGFSRGANKSGGRGFPERGKLARDSRSYTRGIGTTQVIGRGLTTGLPEPPNGKFGMMFEEDVTTCALLRCRPEFVQCLQMRLVVRPLRAGGVPLLATVAR